MQNIVEPKRVDAQEWIRPGTLVRDADGYYGLVLLVYANGALELALGNGLTVLAARERVVPLGLRVGDPANPPASFAELFFPR